MAPRDEFYTAWDGRQYPGRPPSGWFLAADNRWWPNTETIEGGTENITGPGSETVNQEVPERQEPPEQPSARPEQNPPEIKQPPSSWAPESNPSQGSSAEPRPQATPAAPPVARTTRSRKRGWGLRRFPVWPAVFFFFMLSRCGVFDGAAENVVPDDQPTPAIAQDVTSTSGCSPTFLWGSITNDSASFGVFEARTQRVDGGQNYKSEPVRIGASDTRSWVIDFPRDDEPDGFCPPIEIYSSP